MKRIQIYWILLIASLAIQSTYAQSYARVLDTQQWIITEDHPGPGPGGTSTYHWLINEKDTIVSGKSYALVVYHSTGYSGMRRLFREDTLLRKVYQLTDSGEVIIFSFAATHAGQSDTIYNSPCTVDSITLVSTPSGIRKVFYCNVPAHSYTDRVMEGVGSIRFSDVFSTNDHSLEHFCASYDFHGGLIAGYDICPKFAYASGISDLSYSYGLQIYPNPMFGKLHVESQQELSSTNIVVLDLLGRELLSINNLTGYSAGIDLTGIGEGVFLVNVLRDGQTISMIRILNY